MENSAVESTVVGDAADETQIRQPGLFAKVAEHVQGDIFQRLLDPGSEVHVLLSKFLPLPAGWKDLRREDAAERPEFVVAMIAKGVQRVEEASICIRIPIRREPHNFVFVTKSVGEQADGVGIEMSKRFTDMISGQALQPPIYAIIHCRRMAFSAAIHHCYQRLFHARAHETGQGVRDVVFGVY